MAKEFDIDMRLLGLDMFDVNREMPSPEVHNNILAKALEENRLREPSFVIQDKGRADDEYSFVLVRNGQFKGYAFINGDEISLGDIEACAHMLPPTETNASILSTISEHYRGYTKIDNEALIFS